MNRIASLILLVCLAAACGRDKILVVPERLAPGGGGRGDGGSAVYATPALNVLVRMGADSTEFDPEDVMRLEVDGFDRADEMTLGGRYGILTIEPPPPPGTQLFTGVARRIENVGDTFTWVTAAYTGPTLASVDPTITVLTDYVSPAIVEFGDTWFWEGFAAPVRAW